MFYVSSKVNNEIGVTDTDDNIEERYKFNDLLRIIKNNRLVVEGVY